MAAFDLGCGYGAVWPTDEGPAEAVAAVCREPGLDAPEDPIALAPPKNDPTCRRSGNLVENGSFERPGTAIGFWNVVPTAQLGGWRVEWLEDAPCFADDPSPEPLLELRSIGPSPDGLYHAELDSDCHGPGGPCGALERSTVRISQQLATVPGRDYELSFWAKARRNVLSSQLLSVSWDGAPIVAELPAPERWTEYRYEFVATKSTSLLAFEDAGTPDSYGVLLDDVRLFDRVCTPPVSDEPPVGEPPTGDMPPGDEPPPEEPPREDDPTRIDEPPRCESHRAIMYAGQTIESGHAQVDSDGTSIRVRIDGQGPWQIGAVHIYAKMVPIPAKAGRPAPGQFPYQVTYDRPVSSHETVIPMSDLPVACDQAFYLAVHTEMVTADGRKETAWAFGPHPFSASWGWWAMPDLCCPAAIGTSRGLAKEKTGLKTQWGPGSGEGTSTGGTSTSTGGTSTEGTSTGTGGTSTSTGGTSTGGTSTGGTSTSTGGTSTGSTPPASDPMVAPEVTRERVMVSFKNPDASEALLLAESLGASVVWRSRRASFVTLEVDHDEVDRLLEQLLTRDDVEYAERDAIVGVLGRPARVPNDPLFVYEWGLHNWGFTGANPGADLDAVEAWTIETGKADVRVAILDTAVDLEHPDLRSSIAVRSTEVAGNEVDDDDNGYVDDVHGWNFVARSPAVGGAAGGHWHGTHVAGTVGATGDNGLGVAGVTWSSSLLVLEVLDADGAGRVSDVVEALEYAEIEGARVVLAAFGTRTSSRALGDAVGRVSGLVVAAAGNDASDVDASPVYPAAFDHDHIVAVAALGRQDRLACFSNFGPTTIDFAAPGESILSTVPGRGYEKASGTSSAAAFTAGAAALLWSAEPELTTDELRARLLEAVVPVAGLRGRLVTGGRLNLCLALGCDGSCRQDADCDDKVFCNGVEACNEDGACVAGAAVLCASTSADVCSASACSESAKGCVEAPAADGTYCAASGACVASAACFQGDCIPGPPKTCEDTNPCTVESCDPEFGCMSSPLPEGTSCSDNDVCNGREACQAGVCVSSTPLSCQDEDPCTADLCDPRLGCTHDVVADGTRCPDGDFCNGQETCVGGTCVAGVVPACDDDNPCTVGACDSLLGCVYTPVANGTPCGDDANVCNGEEVCRLGVCVSQGALDCGNENPCMIGRCDPALGCASEPAIDGTVCADADACNGIETCHSGTCGAGTPLDCDDANDCTVDTCEALRGCRHAPAPECSGPGLACDPHGDGSDCDDGDACNGVEACDRGMCTAGVAPNCDDQDPCTIDACDPLVGCEHEPDPECAPGFCEVAVDGAPCNDANLCNGQEVCTSGTCGGGVPISCDDGDDCTIDGCEPSLGCVHHVAPGCVIDADACAGLPDGTSCADANPCNGQEACQGGACIAGTPLSCDDATGCTDDRCDPVQGCVHEARCGGPVEIPAEIPELAEPTEDEVVVVTDEQRCPLANVGPRAAVFDAFAVVSVRRELGALGQLRIELECGADLIASMTLEIASLVDDFNDLALLPSEIVIPIPALHANITTLNCLEVSLKIENGNAKRVIWSHAGIRTVLAQGCSADVDCDDARVCNGSESCIDGYCSSGTPVDCGHLTDPCHAGICYEAIGNCVQVPLPAQGCSVPVCGDGVVEATAGEACDNGADNADDAACTLRCEHGRCGDGLLRPATESCDDGNTSEQDACLNGCLPARCGDGRVWQGVEECDDANASNTDACIDDCALARCHDGHVQTFVEACDDGNLSDLDGCVGSCQIARCGDGFVYQGVEECDDGNQEDGDGCDNDCMPSEGPGSTVATGRQHSCALLDGGRVRCWGDAAFGQLGYGSTMDVGDDEAPSVMGDVDVGGRVVALTAGGWHTCALLDTGAVRCWGYGAAGQLGYGFVGSVGDNESPASMGDVPLGGLAVQIEAGDYHTCAVLEDGDVRCWGEGLDGKLGSASTENIGDDETPDEVPPVAIGAAAVRVAAGRSHTCVLLNTGAVRCFGAASQGALGYGNQTAIGDDEVPSVAGDVPLGSTARAIAAGDYHSCAVLSSGAVRCWGYGGSGQLGYANLSTIGDDEPASAAGDVDVGGTVVHISLGYDATCALLVGGNVRCWGSGQHGQLGYANTTTIGDNETPASAGDVAVGARVIDVAVNLQHACVRLQTGGARCWGGANSGQLGYAHLNDLGDDETPASVGDVPLY